MPRFALPVPVLKLLADLLGKACTAYQDRAFRDLPCKRIQCDEIWSLRYAKEKNGPEEMKGQFGFGDVWTWTALCADTKLVPYWLIVGRSAEYASKFMSDLAGRLANRVQLTTDGHRAHLEAAWNAFGNDLDYAMPEKIYSNPPSSAQARYSPGVCCGAKKKSITGKPERKQVSTSYAERQNLTMRMSMRRFTRLSNGFSKKVENLEHAVAIHFMNYNFVRIHKTLRVTPVMEAGITNHVWELEEIVSLIH